MTIQAFIEKAIEGPKRDYMRKPQEWRLSHYEGVGGYYAHIKSRGALYVVRVEAQDLDTVSQYLETL